jgi:hypothetical protein
VPPFELGRQRQREHRAAALHRLARIARDEGGTS